MAHRSMPEWRVRVTPSWAPIALCATALGLHFLSVAHSLLREHGADSSRVGTFVLGAAAYTALLLLAR